MKRLSEIKVEKHSQLLSSEEMKKIVGAYSSYTGTCYYTCYCTRDSGPPKTYSIPCSEEAPWDRDYEGRCKTRLQTCYSSQYLR